MFHVLTSAIIRLLHHAFQDKSNAKRSEITGHLLITMPKVG
jgi:hypothetical protein